MKSEKEVLEALNTLKEVCEETKCCSKCMLRNSHNFCGVMFNSMDDAYERVDDWELKNYENPRLILG